jgi:hypothetical protein
LLASIFIILASSVMFVYWFRYTCLLILAQRYSAEDALKVASTIRLNFPQTQDALASDPRTPGLDRLHECLEKDYRTLTDLLGQTDGGDSIEHRLLAVDYKMMRVCYKLTRKRPSLPHARYALAEMSSILGFFAAEIGQS